MRALLSLALLLTVLAQPSFAQSDAPLLEDPAGDVYATAGGAAPVPQIGTWTALDLRALRIIEDPAGFRFEVQMEDLGDDGPRSDYGNAQVRFTYGGCRFYVNMYRSQDNAAYFGNIYRAVGDNSSSFVRGLPAERDLSTDQLWTTLDRFDITGSAGNVPARAENLKDIRVVTYASLPGVVGSGAMHVGDYMPALATGGATYEVQFGGGQSNGATLATPLPFRSSNGESTVYQFDVTASHSGDKATRFRLFVENVPSGWNVSLPGEIVEVPAGKPITFPLYLETVFRHQHGTAESLQVHLHEVDGERWASLDLGVNFLAVAQPAGHHPRLHLHSSDWAGTAGIVNAPLGSTGGYVTMSTLEEDPADTRKPNLGRSDVFGYNSPANVNSVGVSRFHWSACLEPGLRLGLDFDLAKEGGVEIPISSTRPLPAAHLTGRLLHLGPGSPLQYCFPYEYSDRAATVLAELDFGVFDIDANGRALYTTELRPLPGADYIAAQDGALLVLELNLEAIGMPVGGVGGASLEPGGWLELPLNEYQDAVQIQMPRAGTAPAGFIVEDKPAKDAPSLAVSMLVLALGAVAFARRR